MAKERYKGGVLQDLAELVSFIIGLTINQHLLYLGGKIS